MNRIEDGLSIDDDDEHLRGKESSQGEGCCLYAKTTRLRVSDLNKHKAAQYVKKRSAVTSLYVTKDAFLCRFCKGETSKVTAIIAFFSLSIC